ncbi:MAG: GIY-YIG nuclease family protein [Bacteroidales bacterium]|nr:GIY-YIG nuclease family protein [Bacteroidales bacterium]
MKKYYIYILTNQTKTVLYVGVTNNLKRRISEHFTGKTLKENHFTAKYKCHYLLYFEEFTDIKQAIAREKELKGWRREKKIMLINTKNPTHEFLNNLI